jgi:hypothetical protein
MTATMYKTSNDRPPQIIVIPQSMLSQQTRNLLQFRANNTSTMPPIVIQQQQQPILNSYKRAVLPISRSRPVAAVVGKLLYPVSKVCNNNLLVTVLPIFTIFFNFHAKLIRNDALLIRIILSSVFRIQDPGSGAS